MNRKEILKKAVFILKKVFLKYKNKGIISIYLWGTVLNRDFNPIKSDIDSVAIVKNNFNPNIEEKIKLLLSEKNSGLKHFKINCIFLEEFMRKKQKSRLTRLVHTNLLLLDFRNWRHICGRKFSRSDFLIKEWTYKKALNYRFERFYNFHIPKIRKRDYSYVESTCKNLIRVCDLINQINKGPHEFLYKTLRINSNKENREIVDLLLKLKKNNWNKKLFIHNFKKLIKLTDKISKNPT